LNLKSSALELFQLFFTKNLIQHIVLCTNLYATYIIGQYSPDSPIYIKMTANWYPVTELEILAYFGTIFLSGVVQVKSWREYFEMDPYTHQSSFTNVFSFKRWSLIKKFLYFEDPNNLNSHKLAKIWTIYTTLQV
jgi:hypothetical protein